MDMEATVTEIKINYQPTTPKAAPAPAVFAAKPSVEIVSPKEGATVGPVVNFEVKPANFNVATDLEGKANLAGYGHYHVLNNLATRVDVQEQRHEQELNYALALARLEEMTGVDLYGGKTK